MTDNQILLRRLTELMLRHEQHILLVDILFDDEQIGDFVKSIQIDSPYQQMLLEGVLTESIRAEKLYVSFTVEGYFHYLLGQLIFAESADKGPDLYRSLLMNNSLVGLRGGVEQALINEVYAQNLSRLTWLIDVDEKFTDLVAFPILLYLKAQLNTGDKVENKRQSPSAAIARFIKDLFKERSDRDYEVINAVLLMAKKQALQYVASAIAVNVIRLLKYDSFKSVELIGKSMEYLDDQSLRLKTAKKIIQWIELHKPRGIKALELHSRLAVVFGHLSMNEESEKYFRKCLAFELKKYGLYHLFTSTSYNELGLLKLKRMQTKQARRFFEKSLEIKKRLFDDANVEITVALHNIALSYQYENDFQRCIDQYETVLLRRRKFDGSLSTETALTMSNLAIAYIQSKSDFNRGESLLKEAFSINKQILGDLNKPNNTLYRYFALLERVREGGSDERAINYLQEGLNRTIELMGEGHISVSYYYADLFWLHLDLNQVAAAQQYALSVLKIYRAWLGPNHAETRAAEKLIREKGLKLR